MLKQVALFLAEDAVKILNLNKKPPRCYQHRDGNRSPKIHGLDNHSVSFGAQKIKQLRYFCAKFCCDVATIAWIAHQTSYTKRK